MLSTVHRGNDKVTITRRGKDAEGHYVNAEISQPVCVVDYKSNGGVDTFNQLVETFMSLRRGRKSWKAMFFDMIDGAAINAYRYYQVHCKQKGVALTRQRNPHNTFRTGLSWFDSFQELPLISHHRNEFTIVCQHNHSHNMQLRCIWSSTALLSAIACCAMSRRKSSKLLLSARSAKSICMLVKVTVLPATMSWNLCRKFQLFPHFCTFLGNRVVSSQNYWLVIGLPLPTCHFFLRNTRLLQVINPTIALFFSNYRFAW